MVLVVSESISEGLLACSSAIVADAPAVSPSIFSRPVALGTDVENLIGVFDGDGVVVVMRYADVLSQELLGNLTDESLLAHKVQDPHLVDADVLGCYKRSVLLHAGYLLRWS